MSTTFTQPAEPAHLTTGQAARLIGVSRTTLTKWADSGDIPIFRHGRGRRRFRRSDVLAFIRKNTTGDDHHAA